MLFCARLLVLPPAAVKTTKPKTDVAQSKNQNPPIKAKSKPGTPKPKSEGSQTPPSASNKASGLAQDLSMLGLEEERVKTDNSPVPAMSMKQAELIEKIKNEEASQEKKGVSLVVVGMFLSAPSELLRPILIYEQCFVGHVDAGKSTLMGRMLYELGELSEKEKTANERGSQKVGKSSFAMAWGLDALGDERDRYDLSNGMSLALTLAIRISEA